MLEAIYLYFMDFSRIKKIYLIGIKGVGMTMLAQYFRGQAMEVSGSDTAEKFMTDAALKNSGIPVKEGFAAENIPPDADLIVYSTAYNRENNPEVARALNGRVKILTYPEALSAVFNQKYGIAVVGSHGKTTTTAWLGFVLKEAGFKPNVLVGSFVPQFGGLTVTGSAPYFIAEVDEYQNKLKYFNPKAVLLNNIDYDHPDYFSTGADYENVFLEFVKKIPAKGILIANFDDPAVREKIAPACPGKVISYGLASEADYVADDLKTADGWQYFEVRLSKTEKDWEKNAADSLGNFKIRLFGKHNVYNALAVLAASLELGVTLSEARKYLEEFAGTARRMQLLGDFRGTLVLDDYAHHPTEIKATLAAARERYPAKKITVVFHPHTFTRTKALLNEFAGSFSQADKIIVLDIYGSAREKQGGVHSRDLVEKIKEKNKNKSVLYIPTLEESEEYLRQNIERAEIILLMGAGDVFRIGERLAEKSYKVIKL